jgi:putative OPT family oligopeptide transporter
MSESIQHEEIPSSDTIASGGAHVATRPKGVRELTPRAVLVGLVVAAIIGSSYPYVVMKLGFGPNISVVSAFFGYLMLGLVSKSFNRWENNIVQTAGTSAGQTAFLCVLMAAFDLLRQNPALGFTLELTPLQSFAWLTTAGTLGVLLAVPMRQHFVVDEDLKYADGIATAETLTILDGTSQAGATARTMMIGTFASALFMLVRADARLVPASWTPLPEMMAFGAMGARMAVGVSWSLLSLGSGMLLGMRINTSMLAGTLLSWVIAPWLLPKFGVLSTGFTRRDVLLWVMWPATGMLISGGLTALGLRWRILGRTFQSLRRARVDSGDFPMRWVGIGVAVCLVALTLVQHFVLGMPVWLTLIAVVLSIPLMLVGLRVLGETNWGPISALSNMMQAIFGVIAPGAIAHNMIASGVTGSIATQSEGLMQDYKTGHLIGSTPRFLTYAQLMAIPVGAGAVSIIYPILRDTYGIGGEHGLSSPISQKWAGFAQLLSQGLDALPKGALLALGVGVLLGIVFSVFESTKLRELTPSPTGLGIGMLVPGSAIVTMFLGALVEWYWRRTSPASAGRNVVPLASGFIAGEAIVAVVIPLLVAARLVTLQ